MDNIRILRRLYGDTKTEFMNNYPCIDAVYINGELVYERKRVPHEYTVAQVVIEGREFDVVVPIKAQMAAVRRGEWADCELLPATYEGGRHAQAAE